MHTASSLHFFWLEEELTLNQVQQLMLGNLDLMDKHWCVGSNSRKHRNSPAMVRLGKNPDEEVPLKARRDSGTRVRGT